MDVLRLLKNGGIEFGSSPMTQNPLGYLGCRIVLEEGYLFRSFFQMIEQNPGLCQLNPFITNYLEQYRGCAGANCRDERLDYLEFGRAVEMIGFPGTPAIEIYLTFQGVSAGKPLEIKSFWLDTLLDMELRLGGLRHIIFGDKPEIFQFQTVFSLFELIDGISWGLSFHNMPMECRVQF